MSEGRTVFNVAKEGVVGDGAALPGRPAAAVKGMVGRVLRGGAGQPARAALQRDPPVHQPGKRFRLQIDGMPLGRQVIDAPVDVVAAHDGVLNVLDEGVKQKMAALDERPQRMIDYVCCKVLGRQRASRVM